MEMYSRVTYDPYLTSDFPGSLQRHNTGNLKQIFPEKELRGQSPNSYIHVSVSDLYIPHNRYDYSAEGK
jgi:hypothetical protein